MVPYAQSNYITERNNRMKSRYIGSDFDDFLNEESLLQEATANAFKRVIIWQLKQVIAKKV